MGLDFDSEGCGFGAGEMELVWGIWSDSANAGLGWVAWFWVGKHDFGGWIGF
ncbi:MAG: hypothetical protein ABR574_00960 [Cryomorphaceae bacterium]|nr:hypothetical protein [Flavobacteriales bacterium]